MSHSGDRNGSWVPGEMVRNVLAQEKMTPLCANRLLTTCLGRTPQVLGAGFARLHPGPLARLGFSVCLFSCCYASNPVSTPRSVSPPDVIIRKGGQAGLPFVSGTSSKRLPQESLPTADFACGHPTQKTYCRANKLNLKTSA